ncbi:MAG: AmmeMemoRadiSam system protein A [Rectinemataceae bacterium]|nr:AmmeMemoRadiSam system protein A [Rectinemataceae bacterium]
MHEDFGRLLISLARNAIAEVLEIGPPCSADRTDSRLAPKGASFVTLTESGELRGCIGSLEARRPLGDDIRENAVAAAFDDPRFEPLAMSEFDRIRVEVSLLEPAIPMEFTDETDAMRRLVPGVDGLILSFGGRRATFLPQVWETLPAPKDFLGHLKLKAGLPAAFWDNRITLARYTVRKWKETTWPE